MNAIDSAPHYDPDELEECIRASVAATSRGNPEEDQMIERAIRASVKELQAASAQGDDEAAIQRAIRASMAEAQRGRVASESIDEHNDQHDQSLEKALQHSLQEHHPLTQERSPLNNEQDFDDSAIDTDDDEHIQNAIERSKTDISKSSPKDAELDRAIELSKKAHEDHSENSNKSKTEEEIVLGYVKKQSALEEEHRQKMAKAQDPDDEELKRAMQASLDTQR